MWLLTSFLWFVQLFCDLCCIFLKAQITLNAKCVLSALASFQFIPLKVQIGPTCQNDIFGLHVPVLDVQTFPEAQTAVEFWTEMSFEVSENLLQAAFWVWTSYTTALHSLTITATALSECVAKTLWSLGVYTYLSTLLLLLRDWCRRYRYCCNLGTMIICYVRNVIGTNLFDVLTFLW